MHFTKARPRSSLFEQSVFRGMGPPLHWRRDAARSFAPVSQSPRCRLSSRSQMPLSTLMNYGNLLVEEQENVKRVQLADEYMSGAALAGSSGSSLPEGYKAV